MEALQPKRGGNSVGLEPVDWVAEARAGAVQACLFAGLPLCDAEDVVQDVFHWLMRDGPLVEAPAIPWLSGVVQNFIRRYWRRRRLRTTRESEAACLLRPDTEAESVEVKFSLDEIERRLPGTEARLLHLVRRGASFAEAIKALRIPRGSQSFVRRRLILHLAEGLKASTSPGCERARKRHGDQPSEEPCRQASGRRLPPSEL